MNILITGATDFVGSHILESLINDGHSVYVLKRSYSNIVHIQNIIEQCVVYNLDEIELEQLYENRGGNSFCLPCAV